MRLSFEDWLERVAHLFRNDYCLTLPDIGAERADYEAAYAQGTSAVEYVETYARKYDLTHVGEVMFGR